MLLFLSFWSKIAIFRCSCNPHYMDFCAKAKYFPKEILQQVQRGHTYLLPWPTESCLIWKWLLWFIHRNAINNRQWTLLANNLHRNFSDVAAPLISILVLFACRIYLFFSYLNSLTVQPISFTINSTRKNIGLEGTWKGWKNYSYCQ